MALFIKEIRGHFNLRQPNADKPTNIYFVTVLNGKQYKLSTGVKVYPKFWDYKKQKAVINHRVKALDYRNVQEVNHRLLEINEQFDGFKSFISNNPDTDLETNLFKFIYNNEYKKKVRRMETKKPIPANNKPAINIIDILSKAIDGDYNIAKGTKANYHRGMKLLNAYFNAVEPVTDFKAFSSEFFIMLRDWSETNYKQKDGKEFTVGTINDLLKYACTVVKQYGVRTGYLKKAEASLIEYSTLKDKNQDDDIALRDDELIKLYNYKCSDPIDELVKDVFLLECTTGQRISDTARLSDSVKSVAGINYIELVQQKTGEKIKVDLIFKMAKEILVDKYNYKIPSLVGDTKMAERDVINPRIKKICKAAGIGVDETVTITKHIAGKDKADVSEVPRYEKIASHTGRRTFVTMMVVRGWTYEKIGAYTGQKKLETIQLYDKSKRDVTYIAIFKKNKKAGNILKMIDEEPAGKQDLMSILKTLAGYYNAGINIYSLPEIKTVAKLIKSSSTNVSNEIQKYSNLIWEIGKHTADTELEQIFQLKLKQAGLFSDEVLSADKLEAIWQSELASEEDKYFSAGEQYKRQMSK